MRYPRWRMKAISLPWRAYSGKNSSKDWRAIGTMYLTSRRGWRGCCAVQISRGALRRVARSEAEEAITRASSPALLGSLLTSNTCLVRAPIDVLTPVCERFRPEHRVAIRLRHTLLRLHSYPPARRSHPNSRPRKRLCCGNRTESQQLVLGQSLRKPDVQRDQRRPWRRHPA